MAVFSKAFFFLLNSSPELLESGRKKGGKQTTGLNHFSFSRFIPSLLIFSWFFRFVIRFYIATSERVYFVGFLFLKFLGRVVAPLDDNKSTTKSANLIWFHFVLVFSFFLTQCLFVYSNSFFFFLYMPNSLVSFTSFLFWSGDNQFPPKRKWQRDSADCKKRFWWISICRSDVLFRLLSCMWSTIQFLLTERLPAVLLVSLCILYYHRLGRCIFFFFFKAEILLLVLVLFLFFFFGYFDLIPAFRD